MDPGYLIAIEVTLLYTLLGPVVLLAIYVFFDVFSTDDGKQGTSRNMDTQKPLADPAVWTNDEITTYLSRI